MDVLLIEDDAVVSKIVERTLGVNGCSYTSRTNATEGEELARKKHFDVIILDLGLPDKNGMEVCKSLRSDGITTPILILSAMSGVKTKVQGLEIGADDYLTKPFDVDELTARLNALNRRVTELDNDETEKLLTCGNLKINLLDREFLVGDNVVLLTNNEFDLMVYLLKNSNQVVTREEIASEVWDIHFDTQTNYINVYISYLRKKISEHTNTNYIQTIRGKGFMLECK